MRSSVVLRSRLQVQKLVFSFGAVQFSKRKEEEATRSALGSGFREKIGSRVLRLSRVE